MATWAQAAPGGSPDTRGSVFVLPFARSAPPVLALQALLMRSLEGWGWGHKGLFVSSITCATLNSYWVLIHHGYWSPSTPVPGRGWGLCLCAAEEALDHHLLDE